MSTRATVLVINDEPGIREMLSYVLRMVLPSAGGGVR